MQGVGLRICRDFFGGCLFPAQQIRERASIFKNEPCFRFHASMNYGALAEVSFPKLQPKLALPGSLKHISSSPMCFSAVTEAKERKHSDRSIPVTELPGAVYLCPLHLELLDTKECFSSLFCTVFLSSIAVPSRPSGTFLAVSCFSVRSSVALPTNSAVQTVRHFFGDSGGSSYASFDPATELGVQDRALPRIFDLILCLLTTGSHELSSRHELCCYRPVTITVI